MTEYSHINIKYGFKTKYYTGHNISFQMTPTVGGGDGYSCTTASCAVDLNPGCPKDLKVWDGGNVVACKCSCLAYSTDEYCCRGAFNDPNVCKGGPSAVYFKSKCPGANSYAHDDRTTTCQNTDYNIKFGQLVIEHICFFVKYLPVVLLQCAVAQKTIIQQHPLWEPGKENSRQYKGNLIFDQVLIFGYIYLFSAISFIFFVVLIFYLRVLLINLSCILMFNKKSVAFCNLHLFTNLIFSVSLILWFCVFYFKSLNTPLQLSYPKIPLVTINSHLCSACIRVFLHNLYSSCNQSTNIVSHYENSNIR